MTDGDPGAGADDGTPAPDAPVDDEPAGADPDRDALAGVDPEPDYCAYTTYEETTGTATGTATAPPATGADATGREEAVWDALGGVEDPEMPVSVVDLGLIYGVSVAEGRATVRMTLTYTGCPARERLTDEVAAAAAGAPGIEAAEVRLVWSPPWSVEMVTDRGREALHEFGISV